MNKEEIVKIFNAILRRDPDNVELNRYSSFNRDEMISDLSNCREKFIQLHKVSGDHIKNKTVYNDEDIIDFFASSKYKVAICLSGHLRDYKNNLSSIDKYIVKPLNADVFIHTWSENGKQIKFTKNITGPVPDSKDISEYRDLNDFISNVKSLQIEDNSEFLDSCDELDNKKFFLYGMSLKEGYYGGQAEPKYIYSQFYSINKAFENLKNYSNDNNVQYDIVIKMRADYTLYSGISEKELDLVFENEKNILVPNTPYSNHGHPSCCLCKSNIDHDEHCEDVCDVFAISSFDNMTYYHEIYNHLEDLRIKQNTKNEDLLSKKDFILESKGEFVLCDIWKNCNYEIDCFYPERLFRKYLQNYNLLPSRLAGEVSR